MRTRKSRPMRVRERIYDKDDRTACTVSPNTVSRILVIRSAYHAINRVDLYETDSGAFVPLNRVCPSGILVCTPLGWWLVRETAVPQP